MRRRPMLDQRSAIVAAVDRAARKFDPLNEIQIPPEAAVVAPAANTEPAFLVASDLADDRTKEVAHYQCGQSACEVEIQAALDALPLDGDGTYITRGTVTLSEGAFRVDGTITIPEGAALVGSGVGTVLYANDSDDMEIILEDRAELGNMSISSAPGS